METLNNDRNKRCLTCLVGVLSSPHSVFDVDEQLGVTAAAALWDVTRIEVKDNGRLPVHLCADCRRNLRDAVGFARQAREANQHWLSIADCLQEATIDVKEIRKEIEPAAFIPTLNEGNSLQESMDPIAVGRTEGDSMTNDKEASNEEAPSSPQSGRRRPSNIDEDLSECSESSRFSCNVCAKTFAWKKDLQRHAKSHFLSPSFECAACGRQFLRKDKLKDHQKIHRSLLDPGNGVEASGAAASSTENSPEKLARNCPTCDKVFVWPKDLTRHQRLHQPGDERHKCPFCERHFSRKDNLHTHIKTHGAKAYAEVCNRELRPSPKEGLNGIGEHLCKPHGCKVIQCMVCSSKHSRIADLRAHLLSHHAAEEGISLAAHCEVARIGELLYPDEPGPMSGAVLAARIGSDVAANRLHHLYSISDELGYELSLDSSETESESDSECSAFGAAEPKYSCDLCGAAEQRKYQMFAHQLQRHAWLEAKHVCEDCQRRFVSLQLLQHHRRQQCGNAAKRFHCRKCDTRFMWRDNLQIHLRSCHTAAKRGGGPPEQPESFDCGECGRNFGMQKDLTRHMRMHRSDSPVFRCLWCPRRFYRIENLHRHVRRHDIAADQLQAAECIIRATSQPHGRKEIQCRVCDLPFDTLASLRAHMLRESASALSPHQQYSSSPPYSIVDSHGYEMDLNDSATEDEQPAPHQYSCVLCNLVCKRKYEIVQHQRSIHKHELLPFRCQHCVYRTVCHELLVHHLGMHCLNTSKQYSCDECPFKFTWPENLAEHKKREHSTAAEPEGEQTEGREGVTKSTAEESQLPKSDTKTFPCVHCPRKYNRKDRLSAHIKKFHDPDTVVHTPARRRNAATNARDLRKAAVAKQQYLCAFCGRAVTSSSNLIIHMRRHTGEKPFKCDFCDMAFPRSSDLQCHRRTHTGEKPHQCTVCQKAFSRSYKLQTHMRIHNGERPYKCTYCEKSFTQSNDLTLHIRRHTGERPYVCDLCGERFIQGTALKYHRIMMHGQSEESAQNCKS